MSKLYSPKDIVQAGLCIGCGSCVGQANHLQAKMQFDDYGELKPEGPSGWYDQRTERFTQTCPFSPAAANENELAAGLFSATEKKDPAIGYYRSAYVGFAAEDDFRQQGSSGGLVTWVATELMRRGLIDGVAHVVASDDPQQEGRYFHYRISRSEKEIRQGAKSRYYPIDLSDIIRTIRETPGRYAVVGIPCFIKSIHLLRKEDPVLRERIQYTLGLFCGHMKSARFVESFAWQMKVPVQEVKQVEFRYKDPERPANWYNAMLTMKDGSRINKEWWHLADGDWGAGFFMNHACNYCDDVVAETADVSFGDAWVEPYSSDGKGTNVVVVRSSVVEDLIRKGIEESRLRLDEVDNEFVAKTQAAGLRQRREGLSYRLAWKHNPVQPCKRVAPDKDKPAEDRKLIYRMRYRISAWSHRMFRLAQKLNAPKLYIRWARLSNAIYYSRAYHKGKLSEVMKRLKS